MPPLSQLRSPTLKNLYEQLRFAPKTALLRDIERAEVLASELDAKQDYPEDWIVFRVTGYRPDLDQPAILSGEALLWDLSSLVERLSHDAKLRRDECDSDLFIDANTLCDRWSVSRKTVDRFRKRGLVARRARSGERQSVLLFSTAVISAFENAKDSPIARAAGFSRIEEEEGARIHRRARRYRTSLGYSLNEASLRLAKRFGRSHEGVRQLLQRLDESSANPVFGKPPVRMDRRKVFALRASRLGIEPTEIAKHLNCSRASVARTLVEARADAMRDCTLVEASVPLGNEPDAQNGLADTSADELIVTGWVSNSNHDTDVAALVGHARSLPPPKLADESAVALQRIACEQGASNIVRGFPSANVSAVDVDEAETLLRREARARETLVRMQLGNVVRTIEDGLGDSVDHVSARELAQLMGLAIGAAADVAGRFSPAKGSRLAASVGLAVSRAVTAWDRSGARSSPAGRATPLLREGHTIPDWTLSVSPWQIYLEPDSRVRRFWSEVEEPMRSVLDMRFGLGTTPRTSSEIASALDLTVPRIGPLTRRGIRAALDASRKT